MKIHSTVLILISLTGATAQANPNELLAPLQSQQCMHYLVSTLNGLKTMGLIPASLFSQNLKGYLKLANQANDNLNHGLSNHLLNRVVQKSLNLQRQDWIGEKVVECIEPHLNFQGNRNEQKRKVTAVLRILNQLKKDE